ncbi:unnamed protein product [Rhizophagus irregularis]|uniref:Crinkler family protein n=1 Tax=Rhizophagus irregularis TaxID=588596 RepID=A0A915ZRR3_9GLOM|nr:unnamed protein product [Rhizophagus irregularis]
MVQSFNCYVLGSSDTFAIEFYNHEGTRYVTLGKHIYKLNIFKSGSILNYICIRNEIDETVMRKLKLWKVNVKKKEIKEKNISTEEDIVQELDGKEMEFQELFEEYFQDESNNKNFIVTNIHIITIIPVAGSLKEVLSVILPAKIETSSEIPEGQDLNYYNNNRIPLKERDTNNALGIFKNNVTGSFDRLTSKTNFNFFVCSGAAGIGKTRWGYEFFNCVKKDWSPPPILHIDEYQEIFAFEKWEGGMTEKELFKEMLYTLGPLMAESENRNFYVQTFLSGTASQDVTISFKATEYSFIGLPRAPETVLEECFNRDGFFLKLKEKIFAPFDDVVYSVINRLTTVEHLECDGFLILRNPNPNTYLIEMPFYFIYIYNMWLNTIPTTIHKMFLPELQMAWDTWEKFVANYEVFCNNILVELKKYKEGISLKDFYHGAIGKVSVLNIRVRLEKLELCEAKNQFPKTGLPINRLNNKIMNLDGLVIKNLADRNLIAFIAFQQKWYTTLQKFTIDDAVKECNKNKNAYNYVKDDKLREFLEGAHIVTVIFTSRPFEGNPEDLPDDCLIISKKNFGKYFGPLFASRLTFDIINDLNINSAEPKRIANVIKGVGEAISKKRNISMAIYENRPYKSATEVIEKVVKKNPTYKSYLEDVRTQLESCSYAPFSLLNNEDDSDEYKSLNSNDNVIEMDVNK